MTELLQNASYDQIVLSICCVALMISGTIMHLSVHVGSMTREARTADMQQGRQLKLAGSEAHMQERAA